MGIICIRLVIFFMCSSTIFVSSTDDSDGSSEGNFIHISSKFCSSSSHFNVNVSLLDLVFSSSLLDSMPNFPLGMFDDDEEITLPVSNNTLGSLSANMNLGLPKYQCISCEPPDCVDETICSNAFQVIGNSQKFLMISPSYNVNIKMLTVLEVTCSRHFRNGISLQRLHNKC